MTLNAKVFELMYKIENMPGGKFIVEHNGLMLTRYTLDKNFEDLFSVVSAIERNFDYNTFNNMKNRDQLMLLDQEVVRLLHNFVSAALSLIDHTRRLYNKTYGESNRFIDYNPRIEKDFIKDPQSQFIKCLRQYCQHYRAPNLQYLTRIIGDGVENTVILSLDDLLSYDGWNSAAKQYIGNIEKGVHIKSVSEAYIKKVRTFYMWFDERRVHIHEEEVREFRAVESELLSTQLDLLLQIELSRKDRKNHSLDQIFYNILSPEEIRQLDAVPMENPEHIQLLFDLLGQHFTVSEEKRNIIKSLYNA